jgi:hypothetical protein
MWLANNGSVRKKDAINSRTRFIDRINKSINTSVISLSTAGWFASDQDIFI